MKEFKRGKKGVIDKSLGYHAAFYYVSFEHLLLNLLVHIKKGVKNNEITYIYMEPTLYKKIYDFLISEGLDKNYVKYLSLKNLISDYNKIKEAAWLENIIGKYCSKEKQYNNIRWISQPSFAIEETSKNDFLDFEKVLTDVFKKINSSMLCLYDFHDYMYTQKLINERVISESHKTHSHQFYQCKLVEKNIYFETRLIK